MKKYLVFDWGGTFLKYAYMQEDGTMLEKGKVPSPKKTDTKQHFFDVIDSVINKYPDIQGIAISSAGVIDAKNGIIEVVSVFPYLNGCHICEELSDKYGVKVTIENDGKCSALAELWLGNLSDCDDGAVIVIGTNIGGALILDHRLRRGKRFLAGEVCAMCMDESDTENPYSYMGQRGTPYLCKKIQEAVHLDTTLTGEEAFAYLNAGNKDALAVLKQYTDDIAMLLFNIYVVLDLEKILIGGGISEQPVLMSYLKQSIQEIANVHPDIIKGTNYPLPNIDTCKFHNDANLIGSLYHFLYE